MKISKAIHAALKWENLFFLVFLLPLVLNPWGTASPSEMAKVSFLMVFMGGLFFVLALHTLFSARIKDVYSWPVALGLFLILILILSSTLFSIEPIQSFWGTYERLQGLVTRLLVLGFFVACLYFFQKEDRRFIMWNVVKGVGLIVALWGIVQYFTQDASTPWSSGQLFAGRIFGTLGNPNDFGQFLIFPFMAAVIGLFENRARYFDAVCLTVISLVLLLSQNRASILAVLVASAVYLIFRIRSTRSRWAIFAGFALVLGLFTTVALSNSRSLKSRLVLWQSTLAASAEHPWLGTGLETFTQTIQKTLSPALYQTEKLSEIPDHPHNEVLAILAEQGIVGLLVYGFIAGALVVRLVRFFRSKKTASSALKVAVFSLLATLISSQFGFNLITQEVLIAAALAIVVLSVFSFTTYDWLSGYLKRGFVAVLFLIVSVALIGFPVRLLIMDSAINQAVADTFESRDKGLQSFQRIIDYSPPFAYLYRTVFIFFGQDLDRHPEYYGALSRVHDLHDRLTNGDFEAEAERGTLAFARGDVKEADRIFASVLEKAPAALRVYELWATLAFAHHDFASALKASDSYLSKAPPYWRYGTDLQSYTPEEKEQYRIFMKSNDGFQRILEINRQSKAALGQN